MSSYRYRSGATNSRRLQDVRSRSVRIAYTAALWFLLFSATTSSYYIIHIWVYNNNVNILLWNARPVDYIYNIILYYGAALYRVCRSGQDLLRYIYCFFFSSVHTLFHCTRSFPSSRSEFFFFLSLSPSSKRSRTRLRHPRRRGVARKPRTRRVRIFTLHVQCVCVSPRCGCPVLAAIRLGATRLTSCGAIAY